MKRAILIIDVQNEYFTGKLTVKYPEGSFKNILMVMDAAKENKIPVVLIQHTNPPKLQPLQGVVMNGKFIAKLHRNIMTN
jgi:nicotinamidase-related amidase